MTNREYLNSLSDEGFVNAIETLVVVKGTTKSILAWLQAEREEV
jgi:hypothetical protein